MKFSKLLKPRLLNPEVIECELVNEDGSTEKLSFSIPHEDKVGVNEYFDYIVKNYHLEEIRAQYESELKIHRDNQRREKEHEQRKKEAVELKQLFDTKAQMFELPFIKEASQDIRSALRRAPNQITLNLIAYVAFEKYLEDKKMDCVGYLDYLDELSFKDE